MTRIDRSPMPMPASERPESPCAHTPRRAVFAASVAAALVFAGCAGAPPTRPLPAPAVAVPGSAPGPARGAGRFVWSDQMDAAAGELRRSLQGSSVEVTRTDDDRLWLVVAGDNFESGRGAVKAQAGPLLDKVAAALAPRGRAEIRVVGHTDSRGDVAGNDALSVDRAASVRDWLVMRGVAAQRFTVAGRGSREAIASNDTETGRASNRRVEILVGEPAR